MTAPDPAPRPAPSDDAPVTRTEFDRLINVVYATVDALRDWEVNVLGSNLGESLRQAAVRLNALRDRDPEPGESDAGD